MSDGNVLFLIVREEEFLFINISFIVFWKVRYKVVCVGYFCSFDDEFMLFFF